MNDFDEKRDVELLKQGLGKFPENAENLAEIHDFLIIELRRRLVTMWGYSQLISDGTIEASNEIKSTSYSVQVTSKYLLDMIDEFEKYLGLDLR